MTDYRDTHTWTNDHRNICRECGIVYTAPGAQYWCGAYPVAQTEAKPAPEVNWFQQNRSSG